MTQPLGTKYLNKIKKYYWQGGYCIQIQDIQKVFFNKRCLGQYFKADPAY